MEETSTELESLNDCTQSLVVQFKELDVLKERLRHLLRLGWKDWSMPNPAASATNNLPKLISWGETARIRKRIKELEER